MPLLDIFSKARKEKPQEKPKIIADIHEKESMIIPELCELGLEVEIKSLNLGDYIIKDTIIERKTISDFISSMLSKRIIPQLESMKEYRRNLLIIEGIDEDYLYNDDCKKGVHPNAIRGFLLSILLEFQIPIIFTHNYKDTAKFLSVLAKKEKKDPSLNPKKKSSNKKETLQYILEGFPGIGPKTAKKLLKKYKTIKQIINADIEELKKEIGKKSDIFKLLDEEY